MKRLLATLLFSFTLLMAAGTSLHAANGSGTGYIALKGGAFLPNGTGPNVTDSENGLKDFDNGYNVEVAFGWKPESYLAIEFASGYYSCDGNRSDLTTVSSLTASGIPVTVTVRGIVDVGKLEFSAGAGGGYYYGSVERTSASTVVINETAHGGALGYQVVAGVDFKIAPNVSIGADFKWFMAKPELEFTQLVFGIPTKVKSDWEIGGSVLNAVVKYKF